MMTAPITEEDRPAIESMIKKLKRFRKRDDANGRKFSGEYLGNAIKELIEYGEFKGWWDSDEQLGQ